MSTIPAENTGPFSTTKIAVIAFVSAKVLLALPTSSALVGAVVLGGVAKRLPPTARGKIRGTYAAARELVRSRVDATSRAARQIAEQTKTERTARPRSALRFFSPTLATTEVRPAKSAAANA